MPRFRQYAVYPYEKEFGFSPGFYGPGAKSMEVSMAGRGKKRKVEKLSAGNARLKREIEGKYAERDVIRVVWMAGIPIAILTVWGAVKAAGSEPRKEKLGQVELPKIEVPGLGPVGAALPYLGGSAVFIFGAKFVESKAAKAALIGASAVSGALGIVAGVQSSKKAPPVPVSQAVGGVSVSGEYGKYFLVGTPRFDLTVKSERSLPVRVVISGEQFHEPTGNLEKRWMPEEFTIHPAVPFKHSFYLELPFMVWPDPRKVKFTIREATTGKIMQTFESVFTPR